MKPTNENNLSETTLEFIDYLSKNLTKRDIYMCLIKARIVSTAIKIKSKILRTSNE